MLRRYGFAWFLHESGLGHWVPGRRRREEGVGLPAPVAFRRTLEELGPTAVKLGQALGTRSDILPAEWIEQLQELQDHVAPIPYETVQQVVEEDFGQPLAECFASFEEKPVAAASMAQVHFAVLATGEEVAVKVQRPGIRRQVEGDLALLTQLARTAESRIGWLAQHRVAELVGEFARNLRGELDFSLEARNTKLLKSLLQDDPRGAVPDVYDRVSTPRVLTAERVGGWKPSNADALDAAGLDRPTLARNLAGIVLKQILRDGCFHADPHGGNVLVGPDGRLYFLDCGNIAFVPPHMRDDLVYLLFALFDGNADDVADQVLAIGLSTDRTDDVLFRAEINRHVVAVHSLSTADMFVGDVLEELLRLLFHHHIIMPPIFAQIIRALVLTEAECRALDPDFDFREVARTVVSDTLRRVARPRRAALELYRMGRNLHQHAMLLPKQLLMLMRKADAGGLKLRFEYENLDRPMHRLDTMFNRLAFSIVVAAMILAPALWLQVDVGGGWPLWHPANILLVVGFTLGLWLLASIIRSGRL